MFSLFKKIFLNLLILLIPLFLFAESTQVTKFSFTTDPQSIKPGQLSGEITVQTQNSNGEAEKVSETNDIFFLSSSGTGEFLNATGNPVTTTMSKNTSSRTFYYRDKTEGNHTITVKIVGRETGQSFSTNQTISVSNTTTTNTTSSKDSTDQKKASSVSAHSGQEATSELKKQEPLKVDAGRKRITAINTPIEFFAHLSTQEGKKSQSRFEWSFGDGTSGRGQAVEHIYKFPGDYVIVLNVRHEGVQAVTRTEVKVIDPSIEITDFKKGVGGYVEVKNPSLDEVNIGKWVLHTDKTKFVIAADTIMYPKSNLRIPLELDVELDNIDLYFPNGLLASSFDGQKETVTFDQNLAFERTKILQQIVDLKKELIQKSEIQLGDREVLQEVTEVETSYQTISNDPIETLDQKGENILNVVPTTTNSHLLIEAFEESENTQTPLSSVKNFFKSLFGR
jgi:hypothetical protein